MKTGRTASKAILDKTDDHSKSGTRRRRNHQLSDTDVQSTEVFYKRKSKHDQPSFGVQTDSVDRTLQAIETAGGKVITPKHSIGEWGFMADFADPEGNVIALWEKPKK
jgi:hypothetical protein